MALDGGNDLAHQQSHAVRHVGARHVQDHTTTAATTGAWAPAPPGSSVGNFTMLGSITPEGNVLFSMLSNGVLSSLSGQDAHGRSHAPAPWSCGLTSATATSARRARRHHAGVQHPGRPDLLSSATSAAPSSRPSPAARSRSTRSARLIARTSPWKIRRPTASTSAAAAPCSRVCCRMRCPAHRASSSSPTAPSAAASRSRAPTPTPVRPPSSPARPWWSTARSSRHSPWPAPWAARASSPTPRSPAACCRRATRSAR